jgi:hypothetical protein
LEEVAAVAGIPSWERRLRELKTDEGLAIHRRRLDDVPFVALIGPSPVASLPADLPGDDARAILERDRYCCRMCGAQAGDPDDYDPERGVRLLVRRDHRGEGWRTCCSVCWAGVRRLVDAT